MRRVFLVLALAALMTAMMAASALPALAAPKPGATCNGILKAIVKQTENRPRGANPVLKQKATERGCISSVPAVPPAETRPAA